MEIVIDESLDSNAFMKDINRRVKEMIKQGELCSHCEENKAKGVSIIMERRYRQDNLSQIFIHTIPVCRSCSKRSDLDELNAKKIAEDFETLRSLMNINPNTDSF